MICITATARGSVESDVLSTPDGNCGVAITGYIGSDPVVEIPVSIDGLPVVGVGSEAFQEQFSLTSVTIPEGVTSIGDRAFYLFLSLYGCQNLPAIAIPSGVTYIGDLVFYECTKLITIELPVGLEHLGVSAFQRCYVLESITIPPGITSIGKSMFSNCLALRSVSLPPGLTSIGFNAFVNCEGLESITIPDGVTDIGNFTFSQCSALTTVVLPSSITVIGLGLFSDCTQLGLLTIPESVTSIEPFAFRNCSRLDIRLTNGLTTIGDSAFFGSGLGEIIFPASVTTIGDSAFGENFSLDQYFFLGDAPELGEDSFDGVDSDIGMVYRRPGTNGWDAAFFGGFRVGLWENGFMYSSSGTEITIMGWSYSFNAHRIPETIDGLPVTGIGGEAFREDVFIRQLVIPPSVVSISPYAFNESTLHGLYFEGGAPDLNPEDASFFNSLTVYHLANAAGWGAELGGRPTALWTPGQGALISVMLESTAIELRWNAFQIGDGYAVEHSGNGVSWRIVEEFENVTEHAVSIPRAGMDRRFLRVRTR